MIKIKRIYEPAQTDDGYRILIDGIWPRGIRKSEAGIDEWLREIAPDKALRQWFGHDPDKWEAFEKRYHKLLQQRKHLTGKLKEKESKYGTITLLYAARNEEHNNAVALRSFLLRY